MITRDKAIQMFHRWGDTNDIIDDLDDLSLPDDIKAAEIARAIAHRNKMDEWMDQHLTDAEYNVMAMHYESKLSWHKMVIVTGRPDAALKILHGNAIKKLMGGDNHDED